MSILWAWAAGKEGRKAGRALRSDGETCQATSRDRDVIALPAFDRFNLDVPGRVVADLQKFAADPYASVNRSRLMENRLVKYDEYRREYTLTHKGELIIGQLSLDLFNKFQEPLIVQRHEELSKRARDAADRQIRLARIAEIDLLLNKPFPLNYPSSPFAIRVERSNLINDYDNNLDIETALTDLKLYRHQWRRALACTLYFLEIEHAGGKLHKIGVTMRPIAERLPEIVTDLAPLLGAVKVKTLDTWPHRGNVEFYFKYRYAAQRVTLGNLTEYFTFEKVGDVTRDLRRMQAKELTDLERDILAGGRLQVEIAEDSAEIERRRRVAIRPGMERALARGTHIGRPAGSTETREQLLAKPYAEVVRVALAEGLSLRVAATRAGVSVNTVRKVQAAIEKQETGNLPEDITKPVDGGKERSCTKARKDRHGEDERK